MMSSQSVPEPAEPTIPEGYKPGDVPTGINWPVRVWVILPEKSSPTHQKTFGDILKWAARDLSVTPVRTTQQKGFGGKSFNLMKPPDIAALYKSIHRCRTIVLALSAAKVSLDVSEAPTNANCMTLADYVKHKSSYSMITRPQELEAALERGRIWVESMGCDDHKDPRCLPSCMFFPKSNPNLSSVAGRSEFNAIHRSQERKGHLQDELGRTWEVGPCHTRDLIQVAGCCLPLGFHWDVQTGRDTVLTNGWERWEVPRGGYSNVHPDAHIRGGSATRTHSLGNLESKNISRTPRSVRASKAAKRNAPR